jgi:hypothetical protein
VREHDPHNAFLSSHFPERVDGNQLTGESVRVSVCGGSWDPVVLGGQKEGQKEGWKEGQVPMAEQWKPVSDKAR